MIGRERLTVRLFKERKMTIKNQIRKNDNAILKYFVLDDNSKIKQNKDKKSILIQTYLIEHISIQIFALASPFEEWLGKK